MGTGLMSESKETDPITGPPGPYKEQPGVGGRLVFITGPPGSGKSTSAQLLAREKGFVYYEVDCFWFVKNPYVPIDVAEPTMAMESQRDLVGEGRKERKEAAEKYEAAQAKEELTDEEEKDIEKCHQLLCQDITAERRRLGGDWAVAGFLNGKRERDLVRRFLGSDLVIVMLRLPESVIMERLVKRHGDDEDTLNYVLNYAKAAGVTEEEESIVTVDIEEIMEAETVMKLIFKAVNN